MASLDLHEKANFTRLSRLLVDKGTEALRNTFDGIHSPANLSAVLSANKISLLKLKPRVINDSQWDLLYPPSGDPPDSKTFDVTLLTILFRNICGLPKTGWSVMPVDSDRSIQANIVRIRLFRNDVYAHVTSTQVDNATFESLWKKISQILVDLKISQKDIDELKTCPLGPEEEVYVRILQDWKSHEEESLIMLEGLSNNVKSMESSLNRLTHISEENRDVEKIRRKEKDEDLLRKLAKHNFKSKVRSKVKFFLPGTREWLLEKVNNWFIGNEYGAMILLLTAGPGFGKSVFSARVCEYFKKKGKLAGCHFCDFSDSNLRNPMMMLQSLASQMCENVIGFKEKLLDQLKRPYKVQKLKDAFRIYLQNPLDELELAEPILIVIDALDESAADEKNEIVNLIADYFPVLPEFVKVLVTSRPDVSAAKLSDFPNINIDNNNTDNNLDLKIYLKSHLGSIPDEKEDSKVFEKLVELVQSELQKCDDLDQLMLDEITEFLPKGLHSVYHAYFRRLEDELKAIMPGDFDVLKFLEMLVASKGPIPITFIAIALGLASDCRETKNIISKINVAVSCLLYVSDDLVTVFHKSVVDWLLAKGYKDHEYAVKASDGDRSLWKMCELIFEDVKETVSLRHAVNVTNALEYALAHGLEHLTSCEMRKRYSWLVDVVIVCFFLGIIRANKFSLLKVWKNVVSVDAAMTDELRAKILWHIVEFELVRATTDSFISYLESVLAHSPKGYFSESEKNIAEYLLSQYPRLVANHCNHEVEMIPLAYRDLMSYHIVAVGFSIDKSKAVLAKNDGTIILIDLSTLVDLWQYPTNYESISCCMFAPDDSFLLFGKLETALRIADKKEVPFFRNNDETFVSCDFSPNGKRLVTCNGSSTIKLWDIAQQNLLSLLCTENPVNSCFFNSKGLFIIANRNSEMFKIPIRRVTDTDAEDSFCVWNAVTWQRCDERNKKGEAIAGDLCKRCFPATFELPAFRRLNVMQRQSVPSRKGLWKTWSTGIFNGVECHFALDLESFSAVESTHFTTLAEWNFKTDGLFFHAGLNSGSFRRMTTMDDNRWLYADNARLMVFETLVSTPEQSSRQSTHVLVYSSSFSPDSSRLATCTSDGFVNIWNVDRNKVDQRFKCNQGESRSACWWSEKFLFVFHVSDGIPTLSKYPMDGNLKLLLSERDRSHFPVPFVHLSTVVDFSEGFLIFEYKKENPAFVVDVTGNAGLRMVTLPHIEPKMSVTVSPRCSFVCGAGRDMFYLWKRNGAEASDFKVFFKQSVMKNRVLDNAVPCCGFSSDLTVAVVASLKQLALVGNSVQIIDLDTANYKTVNFPCMSRSSPERLFCFNGVVIYAITNKIIILDLETGIDLYCSFQRYLTAKFLMQMKISPNETMLAVPMVNGDMEFIQLCIAQNPSLPTLKAEIALKCRNSPMMQLRNFTIDD